MRTGEAIKKSIIMKKSITFLGMALLAFGPVVFASYGSRTSNSNEFQSSNCQLTDNVINFTKSGDQGTRFVSSADPSLLSTELATLTKHAKTIDEVATDDSKVIGATLIETNKKLPVKKAKKNTPMKLKKAFKN